jgi:hypothetical protein
MAKPEFTAAPILNLTSICLWTGDAKHPNNRNRARLSRCLGVATFLYRVRIGSSLVVTTFKSIAVCFDFFAFVV